MSTLIFILPHALPSSAATLQVVQLDDAAVPVRTLDAPLSVLPELAGAEGLVLVPASRLSWHRVELPDGTLERGFFQDGSAPRLRSVLEGLLEERVLDDTAQLHFAIAPQARTGVPSWVAACDKTWLKTWLAALDQASRPITRVVPEFTPLSETESPRMVAWGDADAPQLVCASAAGVTPLPAQTTQLQWLIPPGSDDSSASSQWWAEPGVAQWAERLAGHSVQLQTAAERAALAAQSPWDLAQFEFSASRQARSRKRWSAALDAIVRAPQWRTARWSALALLTVQLVGLQAWSWKEQSAQAAKRAAIATVLTSTFPETKVVIDAPVQMARAVTALERQNGAATGADLETILNQLGAVAPENTTPIAIDFIANELRLAGLNSSAPEFANLPALLQTQGYASRWDGGTLVIAATRTGANP